MNRLQMVVNSFTPIVDKTLTSRSWGILYGNLKDNAEVAISKPFSKSVIAYICISKTQSAIGQVPILVMKKIGTPSQSMRQRRFLKIKDNEKEWYYLERIRKEDPLVIIERTKSGSLIQWEPVLENNPWQQLFNRPNYLLSSSAFTEALVGHYMLDGNVWIIGMPSSGKVIPDAIWVTKRSTMEPKKNKAGQLLAWEYNPRGNNAFSSDTDMPKATIPIEERVCHIRSWNPDDPIMGMSPFEPGKAALRIEYKAGRFNEKVLDNDGTPGGAVKTEKYMAPEQIAQFRQQWNEAHAGSENAHNLAILHSGLDYQSMGVTLKSMEHIDLRKFTRDDIIMLLGMNKAVISITEDLNRSISDSQIRSWWQSSNIPMVKRIENAISYQLLKNDPNIKVMYDLSTVDALQDDFKEKTEIAKTYWGMGISFDSINERLGLGFDSGMPGADVGYLPFSLTPAGSVYVEPEQEPETPQIEPPEEEEDEEEGGKIYTTKNNQIIEIKYIDVKTEQERKFEAWEKRTEPIWKNVSNRVASIEKPFEGKIRKVFFTFRKNILSVLHTGKPSKDKSLIIEKRLTVEAINDINEYNAVYEKILLDKYAVGYFDMGITQGIDTIIDQLQNGERIQMTDPFIMSYLSAKKTKIVSVVDTVKHQIEKQMALGAMEGEDIVKLEQRIKHTFNLADARTHVIARTEMGGAMNFGRYAQINRSSFKNKIWYTALDERVRNEEDGDEFWHNQMHGQKLQIGPNSKWAVPGKNGYDYIAYPGDYQGQAANIINDRCIETVDTEDL